MGDQLGRYEILKHLARGDIAELLLARASGLDGFQRHVVIKRLREEFAQDESVVDAFITEARLAATLHHQHIVQVYDIGQQDDAHFFAMEYVHGEEVRRLLSHAFDINQPIPLEHAVAIVMATATALHHAHEQRGSDDKPLSIVHRDVSPANILVGYDGNIKVVDFGIARASLRTAATQAGMLRGKAPYMSPEQCKGGKLDRRSDVFSLGIVLYELVTCRRLFKSSNEYLTMSAVVAGQVPRPSKYRPDLPQSLEAIIMKALSPDPAMRFQTAHQMLEALDQVASEQGMRASSHALAAYMKRVFGERGEPWTPGGSVAPQVDVDFDGKGTGLAPPPAEAHKPKPIAKVTAKTSPIETARALQVAAPVAAMTGVASAPVQIPAGAPVPAEPAAEVTSRKKAASRAPVPPPTRQKQKTIQIPSSAQAAATPPRADATPTPATNGATAQVRAEPAATAAPAPLSPTAFMKKEAGAAHATAASTGAASRSPAPAAPARLGSSASDSARTAAAKNGATDAGKLDAAKPAAATTGTAATSGAADAANPAAASPAAAKPGAGASTSEAARPGSGPPPAAAATPGAGSSTSAAVTPAAAKTDGVKGGGARTDAARADAAKPGVGASTSDAGTPAAANTDGATGGGARTDAARADAAKPGAGASTSAPGTPATAKTDGAKGGGARTDAARADDARPGGGRSDSPFPVLAPADGKGHNPFPVLAPTDPPRAETAPELPPPPKVSSSPSLVLPLKPPEAGEESEVPMAPIRPTPSPIAKPRPVAGDAEDTAVESGTSPGEDTRVDPTRDGFVSPVDAVAEAVAVQRADQPTEIVAPLPPPLVDPSVHGDSFAMEPGRGASKRRWWIAGGVAAVAALALAIGLSGGGGPDTPSGPTAEENEAAIARKQAKQEAEAAAQRAAAEEPRSERTWASTQQAATEEPATPVETAAIGPATDPAPSDPPPSDPPPSEALDAAMTAELAALAPAGLVAAASALPLAEDPPAPPVEPAEPAEPTAKVATAKATTTAKTTTVTAKPVTSKVTTTAKTTTATAKPATAKPTTAKTTTATTAKPATTVKPATTAKPATTKATTTTATTAKPATTKAVTATTAKPATTKAVTARPATVVKKPATKPAKKDGWDPNSLFPK